MRADSTWFDGRRQHVFIAPLSVDKHSLSYQLGTPQDLLFGLDLDAPNVPFDENPHEWSFSDDGAQFAFTIRSSCTNASETKSSGEELRWGDIHASDVFGDDDDDSEEEEEVENWYNEKATERSFDENSRNDAGSQFYLYNICEEQSSSVGWTDDIDICFSSATSSKGLLNVFITLLPFKKWLLRFSRLFYLIGTFLVFYIFSDFLLCYLSQWTGRRFTRGQVRNVSVVSVQA